MGSLALALDRDATARRAAVDRMLAAAPHRGAPAAHGTIGRVDLGVADDPRLPSARLAVAEGIAVAFVGTCDDRAELTKRFGLPPDAPAASVVLELVRRHGDDAPRLIRGPFALAVTDGETVWASRDPIGGSSLFFRHEGGRTWVATEAKQVVAGAGMPLEPDLDVVERIVFAEYDDDTPSALRGVERVPRGMTVRLDRSGARRRRFWNPRDHLETGRYTPDEIAERFHALMGQAAERSLTGADVVSLSGGTDSSAVAAYAAPAYRARFGRPLPALSVVYPRFPEVDERPIIERTVAFLDMELHTYEETSKTLDEVDHWMRLLDGPVPQFFLAESVEHYRRAAAMGYRSMLTGEFAEWIVERRDLLLPHLLLHGRWGALRDHLARQRRVHGVGPKGMARQLAPAFVPPSAERVWTMLRPARVQLPPWIDERRLRQAESAYATPARDRWRGFQIAIFLGPDLAGEADDLAQSVCGLRVRRPFVDLDLVEFFLSLPAEQKFPDTHFKGLIRRLLRGRLPDDLLEHPSKAVFTDAVMARVDYPRLREYLIDPPHRLNGVRYDVLADRLEQGDFDISEYEWAKNLAATHAFLARW